MLLKFAQVPTTSHKFTHIQYLLEVPDFRVKSTSFESVRKPDDHDTLYTKSLERSILVLFHDIMP